MEICSIYHLKWHIIHDRMYENVAVPVTPMVDEQHQQVSPLIIDQTNPISPLSQIKSIEDLRSRYYQVNRLLLNARHQNEESLKYSYDSVKGASIRNNLKVHCLFF